MKKAAVIAGLFVALFIGSAFTAQAGTHYSFGFSIGVGPVAPYGYYAYPAYPVYPYPAYGPYYYSGYYAYPYYPYYPSYRTYVAPRYYGNGGYRYSDSRYNRHDNGNRWGHGQAKSNSRSKSSRWR